VFEPEEAPLGRSRSRLRESVDRAVARGKMTAEEAAGLVGRIAYTTQMADLDGVDAAMEAVTEDPRVKGKLFSTLDEQLPDAQFLASNTSSIPIAEIASWTQRPERVVGLHFFSPVPVMKLVEVVRAIGTSDETVARVTALARSLGKEPIAARDNSGFVVNRLLVPFLLDAIRAYEQGVGSLEDVDTGMKLGCAHPMGPFELLDYVGLDTVYAIAEIMFTEYREARFAPPPLLKRMVVAGRYGRKSGRGFFEYDERGNRK